MAVPFHRQISGWGRATENGSATVDLMFTSVPVIPNDQCASRYRGVYNATSMFCAMQPGGGKDSCQGDSGGPAVIKHGGWYTDISNCRRIRVVTVYRRSCQMHRGMFFTTIHLYVSK